MKRYDVLFVLSLLTFLGMAGKAVAGEAAVASEENPFGFYLDKAQSRYFFDGKKTFTVDRGTLDRNKAKVEVSIDDEPFVGFNGPVDFRQEGRHTLKYRVVNVFNQVLLQKEFNFYLDTSAPESTVEKPAYVREMGGVSYLSDPKGVFITSYDGLSGIRGVEISLDQKNFTLYSPGQNFLEPGKHTVYFRATDNVGNVESMKSFNYVLSAQAPVTALKVDPAAVEQNGETYIGVSSQLSFIWDNPMVPIREVAVSVDGDRFIYSKPFRVGTPGRHVLKFFAVDYAGNTEREQTFRFVTDDGAPKTVASVQGRVVDYGNVKFVGADFRLALASADDGSGLGSIQYRLDDASDKWMVYTDAVKLDRDGPHNIWFRSVDKVGNKEEVQRISVIADMTAPHSTMTPGVAFTKIEGKVYSTFPNVLMFKGEDNLGGMDGVYVSINDGQAQLATTGIPLEDAAENKVVYRAIDRLGNEEEPHTVVIHMAKPEVNVKLISHTKSEEEMSRSQEIAVTDSANVPERATKKSPKKRSLASDKKKAK